MARKSIQQIGVCARCNCNSRDLVVSWLNCSYVCESCFNSERLAYAIGKERERNGLPYNTAYYGAFKVEECYISDDNKTFKITGRTPIYVYYTDGISEQKAKIRIFEYGEYIKTKSGILRAINQVCV